MAANTTAATAYLPTTMYQKVTYLVAGYFGQKRVDAVGADMRYTHPQFHRKNRVESERPRQRGTDRGRLPERHARPTAPGDRHASPVALPPQRVGAMTPMQSCDCGAVAPPRRSFIPEHAIMIKYTISLYAPCETDAVCYGGGAPRYSENAGSAASPSRQTPRHARAAGTPKSPSTNSKTRPH